MEIDTVVVYDDEEAPLRSLRIREVLARLRKDGVLGSMPRIVDAKLRPECVTTLNAVAARGGRAILVADLMARDGSPKGHRLLRAAATRDEIRECTWRVALTRRTSPNVARALDGLAHAMVVYDDSTLEPLGDAIGEALLHAPDEPPATVLVRPEGATDQHPVERKKHLRQVLGNDYTEAMAAAAFRFIETPINDMPLEHPDGLPFFVVPATTSNANVAERSAPAAELTEVPHEAKAEITSKQLIAHVRTINPRLAGWSTARIQTQLRNTLWSVSNSGLNQRLTPEVVNITTAHRVMNRLSDPEEIAAETWLSPAERKLALAFLRAASEKIEARPRSKGTLATDKTASYVIVNEIFRETRYVKASAGHDHWTTCYAVWTLADWQLDRYDLMKSNVGQ
jgi:hypothetical protein